MDKTDIITLLPKDYKEMCWEKGAMTRHRGIQNEEELLMLALFYSSGHSFMEVKNYAKIEFGTDISDVGFMKRFNRCNDWIKAIISKMMNNEVIQYPKPEKLEKYKVLAIDASNVYQRGAVQKAFHLHYAVNLFTLSSDSFKITPQTQGETLKNFDLGKDTIVIADRAYATITGIEYCLENQTDFILRIKNKSFKLFNKDGKEVTLSSVLKDVSEQICDFILYYQSGKELKPLRFCAVKKTKEEIIAEQKRLRRKESRKQTTFFDDTKFTHNYFFVVTSLGDEFTSKDIMDLYRSRWQVEMVFKRYKSILGTGSMPTRTEISSEVWLNCKMLMALLIEKIMSNVDFSPYGNQQKFMEGDEDNLPFDLNVLFYSSKNQSV